MNFTSSLIPSPLEKACQYLVNWGSFRSLI